MPYKSVGTFDMETLREIYDDVTPFFKEITDQGKDMRVMEIAPPDEDADPELWHDDYAVSDGAWAEAGTFEDVWCALDAASGFPDEETLAVFDHADATAKLMVRDAE